MLYWLLTTICKRRRNRLCCSIIYLLTHEREWKKRTWWEAMTLRNLFTMFHWQKTTNLISRCHNLIYKKLWGVWTCRHDRAQLICSRCLLTIIKSQSRKATKAKKRARLDGDNTDTYCAKIWWINRLRCKINIINIHFSGVLGFWGFGVLGLGFRV